MSLSHPSPPVTCHGQHSSCVELTIWDQALGHPESGKLTLRDQALGDPECGTGADSLTSCVSWFF